MCEFVNFSIAKKLKEKGFKEKCLAYYDIDDNVGLLHNTQYGDEYSPYQYTDLLQSHNTDTTVVQPDDSENCCDAPTISQVLKWLREEKEIFIRVTLSYDYSTDADGEQVDRWTFWLFEVFSVGSGSLIYTEEISEYDSFELAALAGIEYVIDNLI